MPHKNRKQVIKKSNKKKSVPAENKLRSAKNKVLSSLREYKSRRPHQSFKQTMRRDYVRSLELPGYVAFTTEVLRMLTRNKNLFIKLTLFYALAGAFFVGIASQDTYSQLTGIVTDAGSEIIEGGWDSAGQTGLLLLSSFTGSFNPELSEAQQVYAVLLLLLTWLTTVWLLRATMNGKKPRFRDGLYNSGSPIIATALVLGVMALQSIPAALGIIAFNVAISLGLFAYGFVAMLITLLVFLLVILSLYWMTSTAIAMVIITLPGMFPWQAIQSAGDMVVGRRLRILKRLLWLMLTNVLFWLAVVLPMIVIDKYSKQALPVIESIPMVPLAVLIVTSFAVVWSASYVYILYRKVVDDDASPA